MEAEEPRVSREAPETNKLRGASQPYFCGFYSYGAPGYGFNHLSRAYRWTTLYDAQHRTLQVIAMGIVII